MSDVVTSEALRPLADDKEAMEEISSHLPSEQTTEGALTSPQFQQALGVFGSALSSGQLGPLMGQFGLSSDVATAAATGGVCVCVRVCCVCVCVSVHACMYTIHVSACCGNFLDFSTLALQMLVNLQKL